MQNPQRPRSKLGQLSPGSRGGTTAPPPRSQSAPQRHGTVRRNERDPEAILLRRATCSRRSTQSPNGRRVCEAPFARLMLVVATSCAPWPVFARRRTPGGHGSAPVEAVVHLVAQSSTARPFITTTSFHPPQRVPGRTKHTAARASCRARHAVARVGNAYGAIFLWRASLGCFVQ